MKKIIGTIALATLLGGCVTTLESVQNTNCDAILNVDDVVYNSTTGFKVFQILSDGTVLASHPGYIRYVINGNTGIRADIGKESFLDIIGFADDRKEFDKLFYSIIGLFDEKIPFGTTDKTIQDYAAKAETPTIGLSRTNKMIEQINSILNSNIMSLCNTRKRFLKYLLLLCGLGYVDFSNDTSSKLNRLKSK